LSVVTKGGDAGKTSLLGGKRVGKDDLRVECYGTIDELNTFVGLSLSLSENGLFSEELDLIQNDLHLLSSHIALAPDAPEDIMGMVPEFREERLKRIEELVYKIESQLPPLNQFILYGGTKFASSLQVLRAVSRRAERALVRLGGAEDVKLIYVAYLNRLSDLFFVMSRAANKHAGAPEKIWKKEL
jgi:cob(I)alamin adenosyltransferase